jgi:NF-X1-type zinc finger protein NFXL1
VDDGDGVALDVGVRDAVADAETVAVGITVVGARGSVAVGLAVMTTVAVRVGVLLVMAEGDGLGVRDGVSVRLDVGATDGVGVNDGVGVKLGVGE